MNIALILGVLEKGLSLWDSKEKSKYVDRLIKLKKEWYEEYNKPLSERSDIKLDSVELQLRILCESFIGGSKQ